MKERFELKEGWELLKITPAARLSLEQLDGAENEWIRAKRFPAMVQDILLDNGMLPEEILVGWCEQATWVDDYDWVYRCRFEKEKTSSKVRIRFGGLDTLADIYLNGTLIGTNEDFYLPQTIDVTDTLEQTNTLVIHFHNTKDYLAAQDFPKEWENTVYRRKLMRKHFHDFPQGQTWGAAYQGAIPYFAPIGVYQRIEVEYADPEELTEDWIRPWITRPYDTGHVDMTVEGTGDGLLQVAIYDGEGQPVAHDEVQVFGPFREELRLSVDAPLLWWPIGFGDPDLYQVEIKLRKNGEVKDKICRNIGFREVVTQGKMDFEINGHLVRLYGGSMDPLQGYSHVFDPRRCDRVYTMIENAHMNCLRIWGEGIPYDDYLYDKADREGILIWQEFYMGNGAYPDTDHYRELCREEAVVLVKRLRYRPSLLMWCGGNETIMGSEYIEKYGTVYGAKIPLEDFPAIVDRYDPGRFYHPSSPYGGEWTNDPREGDFHVYEGIWVYPYSDYPNFISEDIKCAPPVMHSMKRFIKGDLWPEGFTGQFTNDDEFPYPMNWMERTNVGAEGHVKTGRYWEYYDGKNAYEHVYRFAAAAGQAMRRCAEKVRQGSPAGVADPHERIKGHVCCKLLDTWPKIYCAVIDFFQEGFYNYYNVTYAQRPVALSFQQTPDGIHLWLANDTPQRTKGELKFGLFDIKTNEFTLTDTCQVSMDAENSGIVLPLEKYTFFPRCMILYAEYTDPDYPVHDICIDYTDVERHYHFPKAKLDVHMEGDEIVITTDCFARNVEILAEKDGNEFGWLFSENYFDMIPGMEKRVRVVAGGSGNIHVKPHYSDEVVVEYKA